jgi:cystathionine beta-lyase/cystathionine gamma-synthase
MAGPRPCSPRRLRIFPSARLALPDGIDEAAVSVAAQDAMREGRVAMIFIETPANPTNGLVDIAMVRRVADTIGQAQGHAILMDAT